MPYVQHFLFLRPLRKELRASHTVVTVSSLPLGLPSPPPTNFRQCYVLQRGKMTAPSASQQDAAELILD